MGPLLDRAPRGAFLASSAGIAGLVLSAAFAIFPHVLPARIPGRELTIAAAAMSGDTARGMRWWWIPGVAIAASYSYFIDTRLPRVFRAGDADH